MVARPSGELWRNLEQVRRRVGRLHVADVEVGALRSAADGETQIGDLATGATEHHQRRPHLAAVLAAAVARAVVNAAPIGPVGPALRRVLADLYAAAVAANAWTCPVVERHRSVRGVHAAFERLG